MIDIITVSRAINISRLVRVLLTVLNHSSLSLNIVCISGFFFHAMKKLNSSEMKFSISPMRQTFIGNPTLNHKGKV